MSEAIAPPTDAQDAAWVAIATPLSPDQLVSFCQDVERLLRINPFLEFESWRQTEGGFHWRGRNISQQPAIEFDLTLRVTPLKDGLRIDYEGGLKRSTTIRVEAEESGSGSRLTIVDDYSGVSPEEQATRINEVDRSLTTWGQDLWRYLQRWHRWSRIAPWRWYMQRVWQPMKPSARRITYMLLWITLVEIALIALGAGIYWAEFLRG